MCTRVNIKSLLLPSFVYELNSSRHFQINMSFSVRHSKTKTSHTLHYHFIHSFHFHFHFQRQRFLEMSFRCDTLWYVYGTLYFTYARIYYDVRKSSLFYFTSNQCCASPMAIYCGLWNNNCTLFTYMIWWWWLIAIAGNITTNCKIWTLPLWYGKLEIQRSKRKLWECGCMENEITLWLNIQMQFN